MTLDELAVAPFLWLLSLIPAALAITVIRRLQHRPSLPWSPLLLSSGFAAWFVASAFVPKSLANGVVEMLAVGVMAAACVVARYVRVWLTLKSWRVLTAVSLAVLGAALALLVPLLPE